MAGSQPWPGGEDVKGSRRGRVILAGDGGRRIAIVCLDLMVMPAAGEGFVWVEDMVMRRRVRSGTPVSRARMAAGCPKSTIGCNYS